MHVTLTLLFFFCYSWSCYILCQNTSAHPVGKMERDWRWKRKRKHIHNTYTHQSWQIQIKLNSLRCDRIAKSHNTFFISPNICRLYPINFVFILYRSLVAIAFSSFRQNGQNSIFIVSTRVKKSSEKAAKTPNEREKENTCMYHNERENREKERKKVLSTK